MGAWALAPQSSPAQDQAVIGWGGRFTPRGFASATLSGPFVVTILLAACGATTPSPSSSTTNSVSPSPTDLPASPAPSALPSIPASESYAVWRRIEMPDPAPHVYGGEWAADVIAYKGGYLAVGFINGGCCDGGFTTDTRAVVWSSADGATWQLEPDGPAFALGHMVAAATDGQRIVAVGFRAVESTKSPGSVEFGHGAAWASTNASTWTTRTEGLPQFNSVVFFKGRFLGAAAGDGGPEVWSSVDGASWTAEARASTLGRGTMNELRVTPLGLVATGFADGPPAPDGSATTVAVSWVSDGQGRWRRSPDQAAMHMVHIDDVAVIAGRLVAIGGNWNAEGGLFWESEDGLSWAPIDVPALAVECALPHRIITVGVGLLAIGATCSGPAFRAWTSPDGSHWSIGSAYQPGQQSWEPAVQGWLMRPDSNLLAVGYGASAADPYHVAPMAWLAAP